MYERVRFNSWTADRFLALPAFKGISGSAVELPSGAERHLARLMCSTNLADDGAAISARKWLAARVPSLALLVVPRPPVETWRLKEVGGHFSDLLGVAVMLALQKWQRNAH